MTETLKGKVLDPRKLALIKQVSDAQGCEAIIGAAIMLPCPWPAFHNQAETRSALIYPGLSFTVRLGSSVTPILPLPFARPPPIVQLLSVASDAQQGAGPARRGHVGLGLCVRAVTWVFFMHRAWCLALVH